MFQSIKNNRVRKSVDFRNKSQTKASRRVVLNWEGGLETRELLTITVTGVPQWSQLGPSPVNESKTLRIRPEITSGFQWAEGPPGSSTWVDSCRRQFSFSS